MTWMTRRMPSNTGELPPAGSRAGWILAGATMLLVVGWLVLVFLSEPIRFVVYNPHGKTGFELFLAFGQLFGALVLGLLAIEPPRPRMQWLALALLVFGLGTFGFGYAASLYDTTPHPDVTMYGSLFVRTLAIALAAGGLVPAAPPPVTRRVVALLLVSGAVITIVTILEGEHLPDLVRTPDLQTISESTASRVFPGLTPGYFVLGLVPLLASIAATWGAARNYQGRAFEGLLVIGVALLAGAQLHSLFWPSMYSSVLTTTSLLRFGLTVVVIAGGIIELRALSLERAALLADEQRRVRDLEQLNRLKRDFSSIVAHELFTPLAAISNLSQMISRGTLPPDRQREAADRICGEARILQLLVRDIQASADVEREDFAVRLKRVPLSTLLDDARAYAATIQREHPLTVDVPHDITVLADPERIGQVVRNLLNNAIRHTPPGTPITLAAERAARGVRIEVRDEGPGIDPVDQERILEKFVRGEGAGAEGRGLGLYLSQRILQAHGTGLVVASTPGEGARFGFELKESL